MGIRRKISLGFVIIATILLFSGLISVYEFINMRRSVSNLISDNIASINTSSLLLEVTDEYNYAFLKNIGNDTLLHIPDLSKDDRFATYLAGVRDKYTTEEERNMADSVLFAYTAYVHSAKNVKVIWQSDYQNRRTWYFGKLYPIYTQLREYIQKLTHISQKALSANSQNLSESFYRSIMPGVVAVSIGLMLVLLFNYFVNFYFISPLLKMIEGIKNYISYRKSYNVNIDSDDELTDLNSNIREIIDANKTFLRKKSKGFEE